MMTFIDNVLDHITMYRLVLYYLIALLAAALGFGFLGILPYAPVSLIFSTALITTVCWVTNKIFAYTFDAATNTESSLITALILALIIAVVILSNQ